MIPLPYIVYAVVFVLLVIWPLAFFGYRYYASLVAAETQKHQKEAAKH